jgi:regulator of RNase E activity RraA
VFPGDVIASDGDGVIVLPAHLAEELATQAAKMTAYEDCVTERVRAGHPTRGLYLATDPANLDLFKLWRAKNRR